jgi:glycine/D-amino acid oxidase-like deaminating enzyme
VTCLYTETARPPVDTPPLDGGRRVGICVVGGGFTGLSAALYLAEQGVDVTVREAHEPGWGASGHNGGQVNPGLKHDADQVVVDFGDDLGERMVALFRLIERHKIECDALQSGTLRATFHTRDAAAARATAQQCMGRGMPIEVLDEDAAQKIIGTSRYIQAGLVVHAVRRKGRTWHVRTATIPHTHPDPSSSAHDWTGIASSLTLLAMIGSAVPRARRTQ